MPLSQNFTKAQVPGDFNLVPIINLIPYTPDMVDAFDNVNTPDRLNIIQMVKEINIYEDITKPFISGNLTVVDANNIFEMLPIAGFERLELQLMSPHTDNNYNFTIETGHPQYIYSVTNRKQLSQNSQVYIIHFCSQEMIRNKTTFVSRAVNNDFEQIVSDLLHNDLESKKPLFFEKTNSKHKLILPYASPLSHINHICQKSQSIHHISGNYLFFENINGFHYRSLQSLTNKSDGEPRVNVNGFVYSPKRPHVRLGGDEQLEYEMSRIKEFEVKKQFNTIDRLTGGAFCSEMVTHDILFKKFKALSYNYNKDFQINAQMDPHSALPTFPFDARGNAFEDLHSRRYFRSNTSSLFHLKNSTDTISTAPEEEIYQTMQSKNTMMNDLELDITVPGFLGLSAGDVIEVELPRYQGNLPDGIEDRDKKLSGKYLIKAIRHIVELGQRGGHDMILSLRKDAFNQRLPSTDANTFTASEKTEDIMIDVREL